MPPARAGISPTHWEYICVAAAENVTDTANRLGAEGWELAAAAGMGWKEKFAANDRMIWCFKRPLG